MITSDHGHTETKQHLDLTSLLTELDYSVFEHPNVFLRSADSAVTVSGNSFAYIYLASNGAWEAPLTAEVLESEHAGVLGGVAAARRDRVARLPEQRRGCEDSSLATARPCLAWKVHQYTYAFDGADPLRLSLTAQLR